VFIVGVSGNNSMRPTSPAAIEVEVDIELDIHYAR
jgi:hypothetical protein